jgi:FlaA1/EpsC-like NDP-sugar epimerase
MNRFTNTLVNITYCSGIVILIVGLYDNKMRLMNVGDTQWIILSIVLGIVFPLILNALFFKKFSLHFWNKFK